MSTDHEFAMLLIKSAVLTFKKVLKRSRLHVRVIERDGNRHDGDINNSRIGEEI